MFIVINHSTNITFYEIHASAIALMNNTNVSRGTKENKCVYD